MCGQPISCFKNEYKSLVANGLSPEKAANKLLITQECCRKSLLSPVPQPYDLYDRKVVAGGVDDRSGFYFNEVKAKGSAIAVDTSIKPGLDLPTTPGVPTYNPDPSVGTVTYIVSGLLKPIPVKSGDTYMAR